MEKIFDTIIIGFGKAGKTLAVKLSKLGEKVALIEKDANMYGGTCINVGCIPSKRLVTDSKSTPQEEKEKYYADKIEEKNQFISALRKANYNKLIQSKVTIIDGKASFIDDKSIIVNGEILKANRFIINTGAKSIIPNIKGLKESNKVYLSNTIMELKTLPKRLTIIGAGYIGLEFASIYSNFGSKVTLIQDIETFLPKEDEDVSKAIKTSLEEKGINIITGAKVLQINEANVYYELKGENKILEGDAILLATGRKPNTEDLNCEKANVELNEFGAVKTDIYLNTSNKNIFAAGDVCGREQFTYISLDDSRIIFDNIKGNKIRSIENRGAFSYSVFINPTFSSVGLNEKQAIKANLKYRVVKLDVNLIPNAKVLRKTEGFLKALISEDNKILGAQFFCEQSQEIINLIKLAIDNNINFEVIRDFIFTHPTISEGLNDLFSM